MTSDIITMVGNVLAIVFMLWGIILTARNSYPTRSRTKKILTLNFIAWVFSIIVMFVHSGQSDIEGFIIGLDFIRLMTLGGCMGFNVATLMDLPDDPKPVKVISEAERIHAEIMAELEKDFPIDTTWRDDHEQEKSYRYPL